MIKISTEEFSRSQDYKLEYDKEKKADKRMKTRYIELKVFLQISGVNLTELDKIKE